MRALEEIIPQLPEKIQPNPNSLGGFLAYEDILSIVYRHFDIFYRKRIIFKTSTGGRFNYSLDVEDFILLPKASKASGR